MSSSSNRNFSELCRACLRTLKNSQRVAINEFDSGRTKPPSTTKLNSLLLPNLCKLFVILTTYDVNNEYDGFPKRLCEWCYSRLLDYDEFRKLAVRSTEMLYEQWNSCKDGRHNVREHLHKNVNQEKSLEESYDDKLLLPELANMPFHIKPEPGLEAKDAQFTLPSCAEGDANRSQVSYESCDTEVKTEDEELLLPNHAANNSGSTLTCSDEKVVRSKRDRDKKLLHCTDCSKQFYKQVYLDAHVRGTHLGQEKPFQCTNCTKAFSRYNELLLHIKSKHLEMLFRCDYENCNATFSVAIKLKTHREMAHHSLEEHAIRNTHNELEAGNIEFEMDHICYLCRRKYSSKRALKEHIKRHKKIKEHICPECGVAKVTRTELRTHMRIHMPNLEKFRCPQCPQVFNHKNAISRHVKVIHEGIRRYTCKYCPRRFGTQNSQVCHERLHTGERPYACEICNKGFAQIEGLKSHMKNHDKKLRKHVCKYCSQRFITLKNLVNHERRHLGEKPHICNICSKGFHNDKDLNAHRCTHLEASTESNQIIDVLNDTGAFS